MTKRALGGALHEYDLDKLGRMVRAWTSGFDNNGATWQLLAECELRHDELGRLCPCPYSPRP